MLYPSTFDCIVSSLCIVISGAVQLELLRRRGGRLLIAKNEGEARAVMGGRKAEQARSCKILLIVRIAIIDW